MFQCFCNDRIPQPHWISSWGEQVVLSCSNKGLWAFRRKKEWSKPVWFCLLTMVSHSLLKFCQFLLIHFCFTVMCHIPCRFSGPLQIILLFSPTPKHWSVVSADHVLYLSSWCLKIMLREVLSHLQPPVSELLGFICWVQDAMSVFLHLNFIAQDAEMSNTCRATANLVNTSKGNLAQ